MDPALQTVGKVGVAIGPLLATVAFAWLLTEGPVSFGGGEKDIFLAVPLLVWSVVFACSYAALSRHRPLRAVRPVALGAGVATAVVALLWLALFAASFIGHAA